MEVIMESKRWAQKTYSLLTSVTFSRFTSIEASLLSSVDEKRFDPNSKALTESTSKQVKPFAQQVNTPVPSLCSEPKLDSRDPKSKTSERMVRLRLVTLIVRLITALIVLLLIVIPIIRWFSVK
jgi:hypothetical protein